MPKEGPKATTTTTGWESRWYDYDNNYYSGVTRVRDSEVFLSIWNKSRIQANSWGTFYRGMYRYDKSKLDLVYPMLDRIWNNNNVIVFDVDVIGGLNLKKYFGDSALSIFISPLSIQVLEERLINRKTESEYTLTQRLDKAKQELLYNNKFDSVVINDNLETACANVKKLIISFLSSS